MGGVWQDLRYAVRVYSGNKTFTVLVLLTMTIVFAANTGLFTVVNAILLRPLPYPEPDRIAEVYLITRNGPSRYLGYTWFRYAERENHAFEYLSAWTLGPAVSVVSSDSTQMAQSAVVSSDFFRVFGVQPVLGRGFDSADDRPGAAAVAVISDALWRGLFGGDPGALGRSVRISGENYTVIGVMRPGFNGGPDADVWIPFRKAEDWTDRSVGYSVTGRLKPGFTNERAREDIDLLWNGLREQHPDFADRGQFKVSVISYLDSIVGDYRKPMFLISSAALCILAIGCVNVANLLLLRAVARRKEIGVRIALGTTPGRLVRQLLTETLLLSAVSGVAGIFLANIVVHILKRWLSEQLNRGRFVSMEPTVYWLALAITVFTGLACGLAPAIQFRHTNSATALRDFGPAGGGRRIRLFRAGLIVVQIGLSTALLLAAGLLVTSFQKLRSHDLGYTAHGVLTLEVALTDPKFQITAQVATSVQRMMERIGSVPGVQSAAMVNVPPTQFPGLLDITLLPDPTPRGPDAILVAMPHEITQQYFDVMRIPLHAGRIFTEHDSADSEKVAIVNEAFVRKYLRNVNPIGSHLELGRRMGPDFADQPREIIGVVADTRGERSIEREAQPSIYMPLAQTPDRMMAYLNRENSMTLVVRTAIEAQGGVRHAVREAALKVDPALAVAESRPLDEFVESKTSKQKAQTALVSGLALLALLLAVIGLYATLSQALAERLIELSIRSALGATRRDLFSLVMSYGLKLIVVGVLVGVALALFLQKVVASYLYGVRPTEPGVYAVVLAALAVPALAAVVVPAIRATKVQPTRLLRIVRQP